MRQVLESIWSFLECIGRAKAAAALARHGMHKEARALMLKD